MCIFIEIERISIREIKFEEIAVISHLKKPISPVITTIAYPVEIKGIKTHLKVLKIINKTMIKKTVTEIPKI